MQWAWATSLDELWRSPSFPMWATLVISAFFALVVLVVLLRADKTMANGALAVIALLAIGIASTTAVRGFGPPSRNPDPAFDTRGAPQAVALAPALACLDGLAGESVEAACERAVFGSADTAAAAVSYAASQVSRVIVSGSARSLTTEQQALKRAVERDRYGLVAQVITVRDRCIAAECPLFRVLSDSNQIKTNMNERLYDTLVTRYSPSWTTAAATPVPPASALTGLPTLRPTNVDFANSASIPPISIMTPDPPAQHQSPAAGAAAAKSSNAQPQSPAVTGTSAAKSSNAQPAAAGAPAPKSSNAHAQSKRAPPAQAAAPAGRPPSQPAAAGQPRVVAPVPYIPSQVGDKPQGGDN